MASGESNDWINEIREIAGTEPTATEKTADNNRSFDKKIKDLSKDKDPEIRKIIKEKKEELNISKVRKELDTAEEKIKKDIDEKEKIPEHSKIKEIFENTSADERLNIDYKLIENAFKKTENVKTIVSGNPPTTREVLSLDNVTMMSKGGPETDLHSLGEDWTAIRAKSTPEIRFVPIERELTTAENIKLNYFFGDKPDIKTNEVLVVISLNNGNNENENTVVTMVARHKGGQLIFDTSKDRDGKYASGNENRDGLYRVQSEREYKDLLNANSKKETTLDQKVARGQTTIDNYVKNYRDDRGKNVKEHWDDWDKQVTKAPDDRDPLAGKEYTRREEVAKSRKELISALEGRYSESLQKLQEKGNEIINSVEEKVNAIIKRNNEILMDDELLGLIELFSSGNMKEDSKGATFIMKNLAARLGISVVELKSYIQLAKGRKSKAVAATKS